MISAVSTISGREASPRRIDAVDAVRGLALIAMATYHGAWDLMYQGYLSVDVTTEPHWRGYAVGIASTFLFLVGFSLVLADHGGWGRAFRRVGKIALGAAIVSVATYYLFPEEWIFFGVLHHIAVASLLARPLVRAPVPVVAVLAVAAMVLPFYVHLALFDPRYLAWTGLAASPPPSNDFIPVFPWIGLEFLGIAVARIAVWSGVLTTLAGWRYPGLARVLPFFGRHSLLFYIFHQPVLFGLSSLMVFIVPPARPDPLEHFTERCYEACTAGGGDHCQTLCRCTEATLRKGDFSRRFPSMKQDDVLTEVKHTADICRASNGTP